jgi:hypothetical protein
VKRFGQSTEVRLPWASISGFWIAGEGEVKSQELGWSDERVVFVLLAGGGLDDRGKRCSGMRGVEASVSGLRRADEGISSIV